MVSSPAKTVAEYLKSLPEDRRAAISRVRKEIRKRLPKGFEEVMQYGMISYVIPARRYPKTYNGQPLAVASLASQKQYMTVYLMNIYGSPDEARWFETEYKKTGKKLNIGKSCVRFKTLDDLPVELVGEAISRAGVDDFIEMYEASRKGLKGGASRRSPTNARARL